ncbi:M48 family metalloprotease [Streptosporangium lutulentum]
MIGWLSLHTVRIAVRTVRAQSRQRLLVDVTADLGVIHGAYVLPGARPMAYCIPGRRARIVLSAGTLELLGAEELEAVLSHERAHATGRHDLLLLPSWRSRTPSPGFPPRPRPVRSFPCCWRCWPMTRPVAPTEICRWPGRWCGWPPR